MSNATGGLLIIYMQPWDHPISCVFSPASPPSSALCFFQTMSIPMCKGHPGNREAAVDREINKQKAKGREEWWRAEPGDREVNYRPMSPKHTPKTAVSGGNRAFPFSAVFLRISLLSVTIPSLTCPCSTLLLSFTNHYCLVPVLKCALKRCYHNMQESYRIFYFSPHIGQPFGETPRAEKPKKTFTKNTVGGQCWSAEWRECRGRTQEFGCLVWILRPSRDNSSLVCGIVCDCVFVRRSVQATALGCFTTPKMGSSSRSAVDPWTIRHSVSERRVGCISWTWDWFFRPQARQKGGLCSWAEWHCWLRTGIGQWEEEWALFVFSTGFLHALQM